MLMMSMLGSPTNASTPCLFMTIETNSANASIHTFILEKILNVLISMVNDRDSGAVNYRRRESFSLQSWSWQKYGNPAANHSRPHPGSGNGKGILSAGPAISYPPVVDSYKYKKEIDNLQYHRNRHFLPV